MVKLLHPGVLQLVWHFPNGLLCCSGRGVFSLLKQKVSLQFCTADTVAVYSRTDVSGHGGQRSLDKCCQSL